MNQRCFRNCGLAVVTVFLFACHDAPKKSPGDCSGTVDRGQLADTVACFYSLTLAGRGYDLLSVESQKGIKPDVYRIISHGLSQTISAAHPTVLAEEDRNGKHYGRVSVTLDKTSPSCTEVATHTWVREGGRWGYIASWNDTHDVVELKKANKFKEALAVADRWLAKEPFSTEAYEYEMDLTNKLGADAPADKRTLKEEFLQKVLPINPKDTTAIHFILQHASNGDGARALFNQLPANGCGRDEAAFKVAFELADPRNSLEFLDSVHSDAPPELVARILALAKEGKVQLASSIVNPSTTPDLKKVIGKMPGPVAADTAARIGGVLAAAGRPADSDEWIALGVRRDPKNRMINTMKDLRPAFEEHP